MQGIPINIYYRNGVRQNKTGIEKSIRRIQIIQARGNTPLLSLNHLSHSTGLPFKDLKSIVTFPRAFYRIIEVPKANGENRKICIPNNKLMYIQRWILKNILYRNEVHPKAYAYIPGRSAKDCAQQHVGARWGLKIDIENFFGSIHEKNIYKIFRSMGYPNLLAYELSRICLFLDGEKNLKEDNFVYFRTSLPGYLPQGAPSSGYLSNIFMKDFDQEMDKYCIDNSLVYTRYSDDITISTYQDTSRKKILAALHHAENLLKSKNLRLNSKKTRIVPPGSKLVVLGLTVGEDKVYVSKRLSRRIDTHLHSVRKYGLTSYSNHLKFRSDVSFMLHLEGLINYCFGIDKEKFYPKKQEFDELFQVIFSSTY